MGKVIIIHTFLIPNISYSSKDLQNTSSLLLLSYHHHQPQVNNETN